MPLFKNKKHIKQDVLIDRDLFDTIYIPWFMVIEGLSYERSFELCDKLWDNHYNNELLSVTELRGWTANNKQGRNY